MDGMNHYPTRHQDNDTPWVTPDRAYFRNHPGHLVYVRDIWPGEVPSLKISPLLIKLEGTGLYDALRKHLREFPPGAASIRVAVLKIGRWACLRVPVIDWAGRDWGYLQRETANDNLQEISVESVIAKCKALAQQERWDERE